MLIYFMGDPHKYDKNVKSLITEGMTGDMFDG